MFESIFGGKKKDSEGIALVKAGRHREAAAHFEARLASDPHDTEAILELAKIHFRLNNIPKTKEYLLKAVREKLGAEEISSILDITNFKRLSSDRYLNSYPSFSPDGNWVVFSSARRDTDQDGKIRIDDRPGIYAVNTGTGAEVQVAPDDFYNSQPAFSPDGHRVAFLSARTDTNGDGKIDHTDAPALYVKDLSTGREECVVQAPYRPKFPSFSPDGRSILFCSWHSQSNVCGVYLLDLEKRSIRRLQAIFETNFPVFSPDGNRVLFSSWRTDTNRDGAVTITDNSSIYEIDLETGHEALLVEDKFSNSYATYSPDGEQILYLSRRRDTNGDKLINSLDNSGIYVMDRRSRRERMVVSDDHYNKFPAFSSDGRFVVFLGYWRTGTVRKAEGEESSEYFDNKGIHSISLDGKNEREIVSTKHYGCRFLCTSPKKNLAAYVSWRRDTNRGLYLAPIDRSPTMDELKTYIETNL